MIVVTKAGTDPKDRVFPGRCRSCDTEVTYQRSDLTYDQREPGSWIHCPVCTSPIYHREIG